MGNPDTAVPLRLLLVGATGAVGRLALAAALADSRIGEVIAPTRRALPSQDKLNNPVVDFTNLPVDASWWRVDAVICTLGTTIKTAGSRAAFAAVDRDLPIQIARLAREAGATRFALTSSIGANPRGNFYLRTKAEAEAGIREIAYSSYTIVRPSLIDAPRDKPRPAETVALALARLFRPLIPRHYRAVKGELIARVLFEQVLTGEPGEHIIESERL